MLTAPVKGITSCQATVSSINKQDFTKADKFHTFLQVIPVTVNMVQTEELAKTQRQKGKKTKAKHH